MTSSIKAWANWLDRCIIEKGLLHKKLHHLNLLQDGLTKGWACGTNGRKSMKKLCNYRNTQVVPNQEEIHCYSWQLSIIAEAIYRVKLNLSKAHRIMLKVLQEYTENLVPKNFKWEFMEQHKVTIKRR
jgi:hypothetical protein